VQVQQLSARFVFRALAEANTKRGRRMQCTIIDAAQCIVIFWPVIKRAWCEARNTSSSATSLGLPT
jgi:hypothetical protein